MSSIDEQILRRIQDVIRKGESIKTQRYVRIPYSFVHPKYQNERPEGEYKPHVEFASFEEWRTNALFLIQDVTQSDSLYSTNFEEKVKSACVGDVDKGIGILRALKNDVEQGYLTSYESLIVAGLFADFLEMAEYLLSADYKDPAAFLTGAVLEEGLRKMCGSFEISVKQSDDISCLNKKLADKKAYNRIVQKQIHAWKGIRDSADHGKFNDYKAEDVKSMLEGVRRFLGENIK